MRARPAIWPLGVAFVVALIGMIVANAIVLAIAGAIFYKIDGVAHVADHIATWALTLPGLSASAGATGIALAGVAFSGALLAGEPVTTRLTLGKSQARWPLFIAAAVATFAAGFAFAQVTDLFGFGDTGVLAVVAKSISEASWPAWAVSTIGLAFIPGIAEELFFRGFMQTRATERFGAAWGIGSSALLFGIFHVDPKQGSFAFAVGLMLGWFAHRAKSIRISMFAHGASNFLALLTSKVALGPESKPAKLISLLLALLLVAAAIVLIARGTRATLSPAQGSPNQ